MKGTIKRKVKLKNQNQNLFGKSFCKFRKNQKINPQNPRLAHKLEKDIDVNRINYIVI